MLSCSCDIDGYGWYYNPPDDFKTFTAKRRKRCCSCFKLIGQGESCLEFDRFRDPLTDIEERICGDEVYLASWYMCEWCGEMFLNLGAVGYCHYLGDSMKETMEDYWDLTEFKPKDYQKLPKNTATVMGRDGVRK